MLRNLFASISDSFSAGVKPARSTKPRQTVFYVAVVLITLSPGSGASEETDGVWDTTYGILTLDGSGGLYQLEDPEGQIQGLLSGQIEGRMYAGQWKEERGEKLCEDGHLWGAFSFEFNEDYSAFDGSFGTCEEESLSSPWNGVRHEPPDLVNVTLTFLEKRGDSWADASPEGVGYGEPFKIEVEFQDPPEEFPVVVQIDWEDAVQPGKVTVMAVDGGNKLFRSEELVLNYIDGTPVLTSQVTP